MLNIFVSYRRDDSAAITGCLCDRLKAEFGSQNVFVDIDNIPYGEDFLAHIRATLAKCQIVVLVIGDDWRGALPDGSSRLDDPEDFVRMELEFAVSQSIPLLPVVVEGAKLPDVKDWPLPIRKIAMLNAAPLDVGRDFHLHADRIIVSIKGITSQRRDRRLEEPRIPEPSPPSAGKSERDQKDKTVGNTKARAKQKKRTGVSMADAAKGAAEPGNPAPSGRPTTKWFSEVHLSAHIDYTCKNCGYNDAIHKLEYFRDGERPPAACPRCGHGG